MQKRSSACLTLIALMTFTLTIVKLSSHFFTSINNVVFVLASLSYEYCFPHFFCFKTIFKRSFGEHIHMFYLGAIGTPLLVMSPLGFKARVGSALFTFVEANVMYIP